MESKMMLQKTVFVVREAIWDRKKRESEKTTKTDNSSGSKHIHVFFIRKPLFASIFLT